MNGHSFHEEIKCRFKAVNSWYYSVQTLVFLNSLEELKKLEKL